MSRPVSYSLDVSEISEPVYFAYGSNMASSTLAERAVGARRVGIGRLLDHRLGFTLPSHRWGGRAADIVPEIGGVVWGVLWRVEDAGALDGFEVRYDRIEVAVEEDPGQTMSAFTYRVRAELRADDEGIPAPAYLARLVVGAGEAGIPDEYLAFLRSCAG